MPPPAVVDVAFSFDWAPKVGGAHGWLQQVFSRWGSPVEIVTSTRADAFTADSDQSTIHPQAPSKRPELRIHRTAIPLESIDLSLKTAGSTLANVRQVHARMRGSVNRVFCKSVINEGLIGWISCSSALFRESRLIVFVHGEELMVARTSRLLRHLVGKILASSDLIIANSCSTRAILLADYDRAMRIEVVHPGVDSRVERHARVDRTLRPLLGACDRDCVVLTVARMEPRKNHLAVISAIAELRQQGLPVKYLCVGDGPERQRVESFAAASLAPDHYRFLGEVSDEVKASAFASADLFAMPSVHVGHLIEGFGMVFLEAAAWGLPALSGDSGGQREAVRDGETGFVVDGRDPKAVTGALRRLVIDRDLRLRLGTEARRWAAANDWDVCVGRIRSLADSLVPRY